MDPAEPVDDAANDAGTVDPDLLARRAAGRARAERELRIAVVVALVALLVGQVLLLAGLGPVALLAVAVPGTAAGVVLARRWSRMAAGELER